MSAYIVDREHIAFLIDAALHMARGNRSSCFAWYHMRTRYELRLDNAGEVAQMLWTENVRSIEARYPDCIDNPTRRPGPVGERCEYGEHKLTVWHAFDPAQMFKSIDCYEYQTCERDAWEASSAKAFCDAFRHCAAQAIHGYDGAEWGAPKTQREHELEARGQLKAVRP